MNPIHESQVSDFHKALKCMNTIQNGKLSRNADLYKGGIAVVIGSANVDSPSVKALILPCWCWCFCLEGSKSVGTHELVELWVPFDIVVQNILRWLDHRIAF
jgi:hypothetical protein